jgi:hypothetical protein
MALKTDFGILYHEDRRPLYCATESRCTATFGLFLGLIEDGCECERCVRGDSSGDSTASHKEGVEVWFH